MDFSVEQVFRFGSGFPTEIEDRVDLVLGKLEQHGAVIAYGGTDLAIRVTVTDVASPEEARIRGVELIDHGLDDVGLTWDLRRCVRLEVTDHAILEEELNVSTEAYLGVTEVARLLAVSKQRVSELRTSAAFPAPIAELAAGPVWTVSSLHRFIDTWERKPGRPRRVAG